ncbi:MAG: hypothetical protein EON58_03195 [Alphaproteobacteria bacterium]|nr:MAG: hypothetical protein EON58_03195 [Alphaproteobacteria bacterium]
MPGVTHAAAALAQRNDLQPSAALEELLDYLFGLSCRDQEEDGFSSASMAERRRRGFLLAKSMRQDAAAMLASLERLHHNWTAFEAEVQSDPALLEAIFDIDAGGPANLFLPPEVSVLRSLFRTPGDDAAIDMCDDAPGPLDLNSLTAADPCPAGLWEAADQRLQAVVDLPVRARLPRGPVPNKVLREAIVACRGYWIETARRRWSMSSLKVAAARRENRPQYLKGGCEKFVADAFSTAGITFDLSALHSAWETVDAGTRREVNPFARLK